MTKGDLWKKVFILSYGSRGRVHNGKGGMAAVGWSRILRDHVFNHMNKVECTLEVGRGDGVLKPSLPLPQARLCLFQVPSPPQSAPPTENQVFNT